MPRMPKDIEVPELLSTEDLGNGRMSGTIGWKTATAAEFDPNIMKRDDITQFLQGNREVIPARADIKNIISKSKDYYFSEALFNALVGILMDFVLQKLENRHRDKKIVAFYDKWVKVAKIIPVSKSLLLDYFITSNAYWKATDGMLTPKAELNKTFSGAKQATAAKKDNWTKKKIPISYTVLNPELVNVEGTLFNDNYIYTMTVTDQLKAAVKLAKKNNDYKFLIEGMDSSLIKDIETKGTIQLDKDSVGRMTYRKQPYERYAMPAVYAAFPGFLRLQMLRSMDTSTASGFINQLITVTVGNDKYPATPAQLKKIAEMFKSPSKSLVLFWNHTLSVNFHKPDISVLNSEKYGPVIDEIRAALRLSMLMADGSSEGRFATAALASKAVVRRITSALEDLKYQFLIPQYEKIAEVMGFDSIPDIDFGEEALEDPSVQVKIMTALRDRNLVSAQTSMEHYAGLNFENEVKNMENEQKLIEAGILGPPMSPFQNGRGNALAGRPTDKIAEYPTDRDQAPPKGVDPGLK